MISANRSVHVLAEAAWTPQDASLDVPAMPALLRRRMSRLSRMVVTVAMECCRKARVSPAEVRVVFASRHGEMEVTLDLLKQMAEGAALSPMDFSGSVHHTALGYLSIGSKNSRLMRAVAAENESFCCGYLDALGLLHDDESSPVLLIAADDQVPEPFGRWVGKVNRPYAAALLLSRAAGTRKGHVTMTLNASSKSVKTTSGIPALEFLEWFHGEKRTLEMNISGRVWRWER